MALIATAPQLCDCFRPRPQREAERLSLECHRCGREIEVDPSTVTSGHARCSQCGVSLRIEVVEGATAV